MGPKTPEPPKATVTFVFFCHTLDVTLSEEQLAGARLRSGAREPPGIDSLGLVKSVGLYSGPSEHSELHALLRAMITCTNPLKLTF